jgi:hypothetical protein
VGALIPKVFRLQVDTSGDGNIDIKEFERLLEHPRLQLWLNQLEIETTDLVGLFNMLDDGDAWLRNHWAPMGPLCPI